MWHLLQTSMRQAQSRSISQRHHNHHSSQETSFPPILCLCCTVPSFFLFISFVALYHRLSLRHKRGIMAVILVLSAIAVIVLYHIVSSYRSLVRNIALAKSSGLRVVILPVNVFSVLWLATHPLWLPLLAKLPESWKGIWFE